LDQKHDINGLDWINLIQLDLIEINWTELVGLKEMGLK
jgi:hypothetical protein